MIIEVVFIVPIIIIIGAIATVGLIIGLKTNNNINSNIKKEDSLISRLRIELDLQIQKTKDLEKSQYDLIAKLQNLEYQIAAKDKQILKLLEKLSDR